MVPSTSSYVSNCTLPGKGNRFRPRTVFLLLFFVFFLLFACLFAGSSQAAAADPRIYINKYVADLDEPFSLSWYEPAADAIWLYYRYEDGHFQHISSVETSCDGYELSRSRPGKWGFVIRARYNGEIYQSNEVTVYIKPNGLGFAKGDLSLYTNRVFLKPGEKFSLSWYEEDSDDSYIHIWRRPENGDYEYVDSVNKKSMAGYQIVTQGKDIGTWDYCLTATRQGITRQSNEVRVTVSNSAGQTNNIWNVLFVIYRQADVGNFHKYFTDREISEIQYYADNIKYTMEGITGGRMRIGTVEVVVRYNPITSVSGSDYGQGFRALTYGPGGDVDISDLLETRDIQCVVVYAPLSGLERTEGWYGLSPFSLDNMGTPCRALIVNAVDLNRTYYSMEGKTYSIQLGVIVHEMFHLVEQCSLANGWSGFENLHSFQENGYPKNSDKDGDYPWYRDLARDQLKNGKRGFKEESFYIRHK